MNKLLMIAVTLMAATGVVAKEKPKPWVEESPDYVLAAPPADQAQIVFVEPINKIQGMFPIALYEVTGDMHSLLAISWWKGKTVALLPPGKHLLYSAPNHIMEANVEAGKRYYVLLRFIYAHGMQLRPIRTSGDSPYRTTSPDFPEWLKETRWVQKTPDGEAAAAPPTYDRATDAMFQSALKGWLEKSAIERAELTLNPEDAVSP